MKRPIWKKPTTYAVLAVIALWVWFISASEAHAETMLEVAPVVTYAGDRAGGQGAILAHERFAGKYDVGIVLLLDVDDRSNGNRGIEVLRSARLKDFEVGIGWAVWSNEQEAAWSATNTFTLSVGYHIGDRFSVRIRHWSTGGTSDRNSGLDMLTIGYRFGPSH